MSGSSFLSLPFSSHQSSSHTASRFFDRRKELPTFDECGSNKKLKTRQEHEKRRRRSVITKTSRQSFHVSWNLVSPSCKSYTDMYCHHFVQSSFSLPSRQPPLQPPQNSSNQCVHTSISCRHLIFYYSWKEILGSIQTKLRARIELALHHVQHMLPKKTSWTINL